LGGTDVSDRTILKLILRKCGARMWIGLGQYRVKLWASMNTAVKFQFS
jgi:hypothetical protein